LYTNRLVRIALTYTRDIASAEDRVQEALIKAYRNFHQFSGNDPFPWLTKIVINECKMAYRRSWREIVSEALPDFLTSMNIEESIIASEESELVYQNVLQLTEPFRTVIVLFYFEDLTISEIASILQKSEGTVKSRLARAKEKLRILWKENDSYGKQNKKCEVLP
jgi:RNA polymerase sigma-70 factor (ECF subfamily)